jgi:hypothetical protein
MKIQELEAEIFTYLQKEPIHVGGSVVGPVNLTLGKAGLISKGIIDIIKKAAGEPVMEKEEISFEGGEWVLILEE